MLTSINVLLSKTDHPQVREFLNKRVCNGRVILGDTQQQLIYLPKVYEFERSKLLEEIAGKDIAAILDKISGDSGWYILNILFSTMTVEEDGKLDALLVDTVFLSKTNHSTVAQAVVQHSLQVTSILRKRSSSKPTMRRT